MPKSKKVAAFLFLKELPYLQECSIFFSAVKTFSLVRIANHPKTIIQAVFNGHTQCCIQKKFGNKVFSCCSGHLSSMPAKCYWFILFCTLLATSFKVFFWTEHKEAHCLLTSFPCDSYCICSNANEVCFVIPHFGKIVNLVI